MGGKISNKMSIKECHYEESLQYTPLVSCCEEELLPGLCLASVMTAALLATLLSLAPLPSLPSCPPGQWTCPHHGNINNNNNNNNNNTGK